MKAVFVGPSLPDAARYAGADVWLFPPARQGDVFAALEKGATTIGLIDGQFEFVAPVWHKEVMFALSRGVAVLGAASMGALRAVECHDFGMVGVGKIFGEYLCGQRDDDADVALVHGPAEIGYKPLTVPLVNAEATIATALLRGTISSGEAEQLLLAARNLFFKKRTWARIADTCAFDREKVTLLVRDFWTDQKRIDALALLEAIAIDVPSPGRQSWSFNATPLWRTIYARSTGK